MASTFDARLAELEEIVGHGKLIGKVTVDQIYALAIHSGFWRTGPLAGVTNRPRHGGETHFLTNGLYRDSDRFMANLALGLLEPGGLATAMEENVEDLARYVYDHAPRLHDVLRNSAHPQVFRAGHVVYDRPPVAARLSREELDRRGSHVPHSGDGQ